MSSSSRGGRRVAALPDLGHLSRYRRLACAPAASVGGRTLLVLAALSALEGCSVGQAWHRSQTPVAHAPAAAASQLDTPAAGGAGSAGGVQAAASNDSLRGSRAVEPRPDLHVRRSAKLPSGGRDALSATDVGYYMDVLQGRLTQDLGRDARIERRGDSIVLWLPSSFDVDSARLNGAGRQTLRPLAEILIEYRRTLVAVQVRGADSEAQGPNPRLASDRAGALSRYLTAAGLAGRRLSASGEGSHLHYQDQGPNPVAGVGVELQVSPIVIGAGHAY